MTVWRLNDKEISFPDPHLGEPGGLLAVGGDLSAERLLLAYSHGIFPWYGFKENRYIKWYCPMDRFVIFPGKIHVSHSMHTLINKGEYRATFNWDFSAVIRGCSRADGRYYKKGAWLGDDMIRAYESLHSLGFAASVEVWDSKGFLAGGLYGVKIGRCFFGESMFSLQPSASKFALIYLARLMENNGDDMIDCQFETPYLKSMGGEHISYERYMETLNRGMKE